MFLLDAVEVDADRGVVVGHLFLDRDHFAECRRIAIRDLVRRCRVRTVGMDRPSDQGDERRSANEGFHTNWVLG